MARDFLATVAPLKGVPLAHIRSIVVHRDATFAVITVNDRWQVRILQ
jgi:hypothetical protein